MEGESDFEFVLRTCTIRGVPDKKVEDIRAGRAKVLKVTKDMRADRVVACGNILPDMTEDDVSERMIVVAPPPTDKIRTPKQKLERQSAQRAVSRLRTA